MDHHLGKGFARIRASLATRLLVVIAGLLVLLLVTQAPAQAAPGSFDLIAPANAAWCTATCTFRWAGASSAASYQLYVDGALKKDAISSDASSYTLLPSEALTDGFHTWYVVALDSTSGKTQSTSTWSARVDGTPPAAFTLLAPLADAWVGTDTPTFSWTGSSDSGSGLAGYEVWIDGAARTNGLGASVLSSAVPIPPASIFLDGFDSCSGWTMAEIPPSTYNWTCDMQSSIQSSALNVAALSTSGPIGSIATSGVIDLSNVGPARMALHEENCGAQTYQISISDGSAAGFRLLRGTPLSSCTWVNSSLPIDDFTGGSSSAIEFTGVVAPFRAVLVDSVQISGALGGSHSYQVVAIDLAGNRTPSESRTFRYDLPPLPFDVVSPADGSWTNSSKPTFSWNPTTDAGSGLAKYQVWIDGVLAVDNIPVTANMATATSVVTDGAHDWRVYAVDNAGALRRSREDWTLRVDTTPPSSFSVCPGQVTSPTPQVCWNPPSDRGSGLDHYSLTIDGVLNRAKIAATTSGTNCTTPSGALAEGQHTFSVTAYDVAGNATVSDASCGPLVVDFNPPEAFALTSPVGNEDCFDCGSNVVEVDTLTPTFVWQASSSSGSGLDHYEIYIDGGSTCSVCKIPATATSATLTNPLYPGQHYWQIAAFDHVGGSAQGNIPNSQDQRAWFTAKCTGTCLPPEPGPEPAPEPARDGGVDAPMDAFDGPTATATSTATSTLTATSTGTATSTSTTTTTATATTTSIPAEPRPDGALIASSDAPPSTSDAAVLQTDLAGDGVPADSIFNVADALAATSNPDAGLGMADASTAKNLDAKVATSDSGRGNSVDGSRYDAGSNGNGGSSGCGCAIGGHPTVTGWVLIPAVVALLRPWRRRRARR